MKRLTSLILTIFLCALVSVAANNKLLNKAQEQLTAAKTIEDYQSAIETFKSARFDINYSADEHEPLITNGIATCTRRIAALNRKLIVNKSTSTVNNEVDYTGGEITYRIQSTVGKPAIDGLPDWITIVSDTGNEVVVKCALNDTVIARQCAFTFSAGGHSVKAMVHQKGKPRPTNRSTGRSRTAHRERVITDVTISNVDYYNNVITEAGQPMYAHEIRYLRPVIKYDGPSAAEEVVMYTRIYDPDGILMQAPGISPDNYSQKCSVTFYPGNQQEIPYLGWGKRNVSLFRPGMYTFEFIVNDEVIKTAYVPVVEREDDETYLLVNGLSQCDVQFKGEGGEFIFYISTSDADWTVNELPDYITVVKKTDTSLTIQYPANLEIKDRQFSFYVRGAGRQVTINVDQPTNGPSAIMENVRVVENVTRNGDKGIEIHANISLRNARAHRGQIVVFFYNGTTGEKLYDIDNNFCAQDGQVSVYQVILPDKDEYDMGDVVLFLPYDQLDIRDAGETLVEFEMGIYDGRVGDFLAYSKRIQFTYRR